MEFLEKILNSDISFSKTRISRDMIIEELQKKNNYLSQNL